MFIKSIFAFGAGFISFLTPCVLPIIPGYISYITGKPLEEIEKKEALEKYGSEGSGKNLPFSSLSEDLKKKEEKN